ncbi:FtsQ-type POTRA domain-containing protein [Alphaproteobacteria bacterium]|nr:FtsQ-type POTRA domain-containing protein [Alphaproteobacteria bacterium]
MNRKFLKYIFIAISLCLFLAYIYYELIKRDKFYSIIHYISEKYNYQLKNVEINSLQRINKFEINNIINQYYSQSIFLLPLEEISNSINQLSWAKEVNLSINFINKLNVEIFEYKPIGLLFYNNQLFYFSKDGKIIDRFREELNESLIIFHGNQASKVAYNFLNVINKTETFNMIKEAFFINERRWDIKLHNNILLNLSEINIEESLKNYNKLIKKFNNSDIVVIKSIDLRDSEKVIISFK